MTMKLEMLVKEVTLCGLTKFHDDSFTTDEVRDQKVMQVGNANQPFSPKTTQNAVSFDLVLTRADTAMIFFSVRVIASQTFTYNLPSAHFRHFSHSLAAFQIRRVASLSRAKLAIEEKKG